MGLGIQWLAALISHDQWPAQQALGQRNRRRQPLPAAAVGGEVHGGAPLPRLLLTVGISSLAGHVG